MARQYEFRPAKAAQRRMIVDACRRLTAIASLDAYQYVGFGGLEFIDFVEFHRGLGIPCMTSIERDTQIAHRLEFNKPYRGIRILMGEARDRLPEVDWSRLAITWLDYTETLSTDILRDVEFVIRSSVPGSVVIVTVNGAAGAPVGERLQVLRERLGDLVSDNLPASAAYEWGPAIIQREVLQATAHSAGRAAHGAPFRQLFNFHYADDAKMLTWGGAVSALSVDRTIDACRFDDLPFVRTGDEAFEIKVPLLTDREIAHLETELGVRADGPMPKLKGVTPAEVKDLARVYRWRVGTK